MHWFIDPIKNHYVDFKGRATRQEFGMFTLIHISLAIMFAVIDEVLGLGFLYPFFVLAVLLPNLAISVRRCHDLGRSGWWVLMFLVPLLGLALLLGLLIRKSDVSTNAYGPNSSAPTADGVPVPPSVGTHNDSVDASVMPTAPVPVPETEPVEENKQEGFGG